MELLLQVLDLEGAPLIFLAVLIDKLVQLVALGFSVAARLVRRTMAACGFVVVGVRLRKETPTESLVIVRLF